jgi:hypothetical protein
LENERISRTRQQAVGVETLPGPPSWARQAACAGKATADHDPWHPDPEAPASVRRSLVAEAMATCVTCPVQVQCGRRGIELLADDSAVAVYGGMTPEALRGLARRLGRTTRKEAQHGTRARYVKGCRCPDCRGANARGEAARRTAKGRRQLRECPARTWNGSLCRRTAKDGSVFCPAHAIPGDSSDRTDSLGL